MATAASKDWWVQLRRAWLSRLRLLMFGKPLATSVQLHERLPVYLALPVFASDAISSMAYGPQEILIVLAALPLAAGGTAVRYLMWIALPIAALMLIVATSYRRAVHLYPTSGGSYTVAKSNLGAFVGLIAASALLIDYVMTVAVSISSGVDALTSAYHVLRPYNVLLACSLVAFMAWVNLRGTKESGWWFSLPLYLFTFALGTMLLFILYRYLTHSITPLPPPKNVIEPRVSHVAGLLLAFGILHAFSNGCSSMTGVEAVSNGVSAFRPPEARNAAKTLGLLVTIMVCLFLGTCLGAHLYHALPVDPEKGGETVLSQVARATFGRTGFYFLIQYATLAILLVAANTSFADFPRLLAFVARDDFAPKAFLSLGDRLVYNRGITALALICGALILAFKANVNKLIGLYAVGVFLCFTLSQLGMARKLSTAREKNWARATLLNIVGATATGTVTVVVLVTKFFHGAWIVSILIPLLLVIAYMIARHYAWFVRTMTVEPKDYNPLREPVEPLTVVVLLSSDIHRGILEGLECARAVAADRPDAQVRALHIEMDPDKTQRLKSKWAQFVQPYLGNSIRLDVVSSPYRWLVEPITDYLDGIEHERPGARVVVVLPEFETGNVVTHFLHNFTGRRLRGVLLSRPRVTVVSVRYFMKTMAKPLIQRQPLRKESRSD